MSIDTNFHTALHNKPGGVYTPEELRGMLQPLQARKEVAR